MTQIGSLDPTLSFFSVNAFLSLEKKEKGLGPGGFEPPSVGHFELSLLSRHFIASDQFLFLHRPFGLSAPGFCLFTLLSFLVKLFSFFDKKEKRFAGAN